MPGCGRERCVLVLGACTAACGGSARGSGERAGLAKENWARRTSAPRIAGVRALLGAAAGCSAPAACPCARRAPLRLTGRPARADGGVRRARAAGSERWCGERWCRERWCRERAHPRDGRGCEERWCWDAGSAARWCWERAQPRARQSGEPAGPARAKAWEDWARRSSAPCIAGVRALLGAAAACSAPAACPCARRAPFIATHSLRGPTAA